MRCDLERWEAERCDGEWVSSREWCDFERCDFESLSLFVCGLFESLSLLVCGRSECDLWDFDLCDFEWLCDLCEFDLCDFDLWEADRCDLEPLCDFESLCVCEGDCCEAELCESDPDWDSCDELSEFVGEHVPFPSIQLLTTCDVFVHDELHTAVKLTPLGVKPGRHSSVQLPPGIVYDALQSDELVWPSGNAGNSKHAGEYAYRVTPSICTNGENSPENVCDWIWSCSIVVPAGGIVVLDAVVHVMLLGISLMVGTRSMKTDAPICTNPLSRNWTCTTNSVLLATAPAANAYIVTSPALRAANDSGGRLTTWLMIGAKSRMEQLPVISEKKLSPSYGPPMTAPP